MLRRRRPEREIGSREVVVMTQSSMIIGWRSRVVHDLRCETHRRASSKKKGAARRQIRLEILPPLRMISRILTHDDSSFRHLVVEKNHFAMTGLTCIQYQPWMQIRKSAGFPIIKHTIGFNVFSRFEILNWEDRVRSAKNFGLKSRGAETPSQILDLQERIVGQWRDKFGERLDISNRSLIEIAMLTLGSDKSVMSIVS